MNKQYSDYIENLKLDQQSASGQCFDVCIEMKKKFPELRFAKGFYNDAKAGWRGHWWLKTASGEIIDPTAIQFPTNGNGKYEEWK